MKKDMPTPRFIPAGAGNTSDIMHLFPSLSVHPRGCGEHSSSVFRALADNGSSPRVRGTRRWQSWRGSDRRFIPAGAGNTNRNPDQVDAQTVHPRGCGEHLPGVDYQCRCGGSSPRVRGTPVHTWPLMAISTVHPRGCGEHKLKTVTQQTIDGSSPRVRGTLRPQTWGKSHRRFIPAGAGNTTRAAAKK